MKAKQSLQMDNQLFQQAMTLHQSGQLPQAAQMFKKLLKASPNHLQILFFLAIIELQQNNHEAAVNLFKKALQLKPEFTEAQFYMGIALAMSNRMQLAVEAFDKVIALSPAHFEAHNNRGNALKELGQLESALLSFDKAISIKPDFADAYNNRGVALQELKQFEAALCEFGNAIKLNPVNAGYYYNQGTALKELDSLQEALVCYQQAIFLNSAHYEAYNNLGQLYLTLKQLDNALNCFNQSIAIKSDFVEPYFNKAWIKLLAGDFEDGWRLYEWRWQIDGYLPARDFSQPLWLGDQSLVDKVILIHMEQGLGDVIQFCRYFPLLESLQAKVLIEVKKELKSLLSSLKGNFTLIDQGEILPGFDLHCPLLSLPLAFKTTVETIPVSIPYLFADRDKQNYWREHLGPKNFQLRVGLVFSGSKEHKNDHKRSIPIELLEPLLAMPLDFHSLQKEFRLDDRQKLTDFSQLRIHELDDFTDTAALIAEMDLVISVDTSVAHLAGAMGKPVWILLPYSPDFRWMLERTDSPWYPAATLFRQTIAGDWSVVISELVAKLSKDYGIEIEV